MCCVQGIYLANTATCPIQEGNACCLHVAVGGKVGYVACQVL